jgi:hypothetical protein
MKNKYNIGDILTNENNTVEFIVVEITAQYEEISLGFRFHHVINSISYKLVRENDNLYINEDMIDLLFKLKENK